MKSLLMVVTTILSATALSGCIDNTGAALTNGPDALGALAPPVPKDTGSHGEYQRLTGINGDAIAAIGGTPEEPYIYYDPVASNQAAAQKAPEMICKNYGKTLKSYRITQPADRVTQPGVSVLAVKCSA